MRTTVEIDQDKYEAAKDELGTDTIKDTVNGALAYVALRGTRVAERISASDLWGEDVGDPEMMRQARR